MKQKNTRKKLTEAGDFMLAADGHVSLVTGRIYAGHDRRVYSKLYPTQSIVVPCWKPQIETFDTMQAISQVSELISRYSSWTGRLASVVSIHDRAYALTAQSNLQEARQELGTLLGADHYHSAAYLTPALTPSL